MVAVAGLEPALSCPNWILNPACLPISPHRHRHVLQLIAAKGRHYRAHPSSIQAYFIRQFSYGSKIIFFDIMPS